MPSAALSVALNGRRCWAVTGGAGGLANVDRDGSAGGVGNALDAGCTAAVDMYFVVDQSGSMADGTPSKWSAISGALVAFVRDPANDGIGAGLEYFPTDSGPDGGTQCTKNSPTCRVPSRLAISMFRSQVAARGRRPTTPNRRRRSLGSPGRRRTSRRRSMPTVRLAARRRIRRSRVRTQYAQGFAEERTRAVRPSSYSSRTAILPDATRATPLTRFSTWISWRPLSRATKSARAFLFYSDVRHRRREFAHVARRARPSTSGGTKSAIIIDTAGNVEQEVCHGAPVPSLRSSNVVRSVKTFPFDNVRTRVYLSDFYARVGATRVAEPAAGQNSTCPSPSYSAPMSKGSLLPEGARILAGNVVPEGAEPIALAYARHQFGILVPRLGDGRALLLGEVVRQRRTAERDIQFERRRAHSFFTWRGESAPHSARCCANTS